MRNYIDISEKVLLWAIARAGFDVTEFTLQFPKVKDWMDKKKKPTVKQLEKFSSRVHLPFGYLFLKEPPKENLPFPFFRTIGNGQDEVSVNVYDTILLLQWRQEWLSGYLMDNGHSPLDFVGKFKDEKDPVKLAGHIRQLTGLEEGWAKPFAYLYETVNSLVEKIEELGVITMFNGVVENNTKRPIKVEECRGFVLVDDYSPVMFVNSRDAKAAQLFTIIHEFAHILLGHSAGFDNRNLLPADDPIEKLCDQVAAEFLVPEETFNRLWAEAPEIARVSRFFKVSQIVVARRALDLGKITKKEFFAFYKDYIGKLKGKKENQSPGGDFYRTVKKRVSPTFAAYVHHAVKTNQLSYREAYRLTSLTGKTFENFFKKQ